MSFILRAAHTQFLRIRSRNQKQKYLSGSSLVTFSFSITMVIFAFFVSTFVNNQRSAYTLSYAFLIAGLALQAVFSRAELVYYLFYSDTIETSGVILRTLFSLYPPFSFSKIFDDITRMGFSNSLSSLYPEVRHSDPGSA